MGESGVKLGALPRHVASPDPSVYWSENYVTLDFETTSYDKGSPSNPANRIVLACWKQGNLPVQHCWGSEYEQGELVAAVEAADFIVAHSAKFELGWLARCGVDLRKVLVYDTLLGEYVLGGNTYSIRDLGLDKVLARYGRKGKAGPPSWMIRQGWPVEDIPRKWLLTYCERDVEGCHEVFLDQLDKLKGSRLLPIVYQRCLLTPALADIESNGMQLDCNEVLRLEEHEEETYIRLTNELTEFCGGIEPTKTKQLANFVYEDLGFSVPVDYKRRPLLTPGGDYSVSAIVMDALNPTTERQRTFLSLYNQWRESNARLTKYLRKFGGCCREDGGRLYGSFNQSSTRTHRLSSAGSRWRVQFQNFSRHFKPLFTARRAGWSVGEADGAQLEFRAAAHLGRDATALRYIIEPGADIHRFTASVLNGITEDEVTRDQRQGAKPDTFKPLYGGSSGTVDQQRYYEAFKKKYKGVADTQQGWTHDVLRDKSLTTEWGLVYHWPNTRMQESGYITNTTSIYNYPVQAFATAEIIPLALVCAWHRMRDWESFLVNTVHDSIIAELHPDEVPAWHDLAQQCLIRDVYPLLQTLYGVRLTVPLGAGVMVGSHWGSAEAKDSEVTYEADESLWKEAAQEAEML